MRLSRIPTFVELTTAIDATFKLEESESESWHHRDFLTYPAPSVQWISSLENAFMSFDSHHIAMLGLPPPFQPCFSPRFHFLNSHWDKIESCGRRLALSTSPFASWLQQIMASLWHQDTYITSLHRNCLSTGSLNWDFWVIQPLITTARQWLGVFIPII